jgi:hypothetical protein
VDYDAQAQRECDLMRKTVGSHAVPMVQFDKGITEAFPLLAERQLAPFPLLDMAE